jgi:hypothetical protein
MNESDNFWNIPKAKVERRTASGKSILISARIGCEALVWGWEGVGF